MMLSCTHTELPPVHAALLRHCADSIAMLSNWLHVGVGALDEVKACASRHSRYSHHIDSACLGIAS